MSKNKLLVSILSCSFLMLGACTYGNNKYDYKDARESYLEESDYFSLFSPANLTFNFENKTIKWNAVSGAAYYDLKLNGDLIKANISETSIKLSDSVSETYFPAGSQTLISVCAKNSKETDAIKSKYSSYLYDPLTHSDVSIFKYSLTENNEICIDGVAANATDTDLNNLIISDSIAGFTVTEIAANAFAKNRKITTVTLPASLKVIGEKAFSESYVSKITLNDSLETIGKGAFYRCSYLKEITIPSSVKLIDDDAFNGDVKLVSLKFNDNSMLETIGSYAFSNISIADGNKNGTITLPSSLKVIKEGAFSDILTLGDVYFEDNSSLEYIGDKAFYGTKINSFNVPKYVSYIGNSAFANCYSLKKVLINDNTLLQSFGDSCFYNDSALLYVGDSENDKIDLSEYASMTSAQKGKVKRNIYLPDSIITIGANCFAKGKYNSFVCSSSSLLETIGESAFEGVSTLESITLPSSLITISAKAFKGCELIDTVKFNADSKIESIDSTSFANTKYADNLKGEELIINGILVQASKEQLSATDLTIDDSIKYISSNCFKGASVKNLTLSNNLIKIFDNAFSNCKELLHINIPSSVTYIGESAFEGCINADLSFNGNNLTYIGEKAFTKLNSNLNTFETLDLPDSVSYIGTSAFASISSLKNVNMPESLETLCAKAFFGDYKIESLVFGANLISIGESCFACEVSTGKEGILSTSELITLDFDSAINLKEIGKKAFYGANKITTVNFPSSLELIGEEAFNYASLLNPTFNSNSSLVSIANRAFANTSIATIDLPETIESLGAYIFENSPISNISLASDLFKNSDDKVIHSYTFANLLGLENIYIPSSVTLIDNYAFSGCSNLIDIDMASYDTLVAANGLTGTKFADGFTNGEILINGILTSFTRDEVDIVIESDIIGIADGLFANTNIHSIVLPSSLKSIGANAFANCKNLVSVTFSDSSELETIGANAFNNCIMLSSINLEATAIQTIEESAFAYNNSLSKISFPDTLIEIKDNAFTMTSLAIINIPDSVETIGNQAFYNIGTAHNIRLPYTSWVITPTVSEINFNSTSLLTRIGEYAFAYNNISKINFPIDHDIYLDEGCFAYSYNLEEFNIDENINFAANVLYGSTNIKEVTVPGERSVLILFGGYASLLPNSLKKVTIAASSKEIAANAFNGCSSINEIIIPNSVTKIGDFAFFGCKSLTSLELLGVTSIGSGAFVGCQELETITLGSALDYVGDKAFMSTKWLKNIDSEFVVIDGLLIAYNGNKTNVTLPNTVTTICGGAFSGNKYLKSITLPSSVNEILSGSFDSCTSLTSITIQSTEVVKIELYVFDTLQNLTIKVPDKSLYEKDIYWSLYEDLLR